MLKPSLLASLVASLFAMTAVAEETPTKRMVMTWVAPYAVDKCRNRLNESFGGVGMKDGLTHLALQFWAPTKTGEVERPTKYGAISDATVSTFRDWGNSHGVRVMLCIFNGVDAWDWPLARAAFADHRKEFVDALVAETERLALDGVDVDLEGNGSLDSAKDAFVQFVRELSDRLHAAGKQITVDSFSYKWNAPNQTWWADLLPLVDGLTTMGYDEIGANASDWRSYTAQKAAAGAHASKLLIGMPGDKAQWQKTKADEHLAWVIRDQTVGLSIWDAQLEAPVWRTRSVWEGIAKLRVTK